MRATEPAAYGLTTSEAIRAFREGRVEALPRSNRWKHFVEDHCSGQHSDQTAFARVCPVCRMLARSAA